MIWTHTARLAVYYDGVTIISIMWDMLYGYQAAFWGAILAADFSSSRVVIHQIQLFSIL